MTFEQAKQQIAEQKQRIAELETEKITNLAELLNCKQSEIDKDKRITELEAGLKKIANTSDDAPQAMRVIAKELLK